MWEMNPSPLQEQKVTLMTDPSKVYTANERRFSISHCPLKNLSFDDSFTLRQSNL